MKNQYYRDRRGMWAIAGKSPFRELGVEIVGGVAVAGVVILLAAILWVLG